jgi:DNA-binding response OmpR family regulator
LSDAIIRYTVGNVSYEPETATLVGVRGSMQLSAQLGRLAERMMRRPGVLVSKSDLIGCLYPDPDEETETSEAWLRQRIQHLRTLLWLMSAQSVRLRTERGIGYAVEPCRRS